MTQYPIDQPINNFDYPVEDKPINLNDHLRQMVGKFHELADLESKRMSDPDWVYEQVWMMSMEATERLPEHATFSDYVAAGATFQGWQWVYRGEEDESPES